MRARHGLIRALLALDRTEEVVHHAQEMLLLNPIDSQGIRDGLLIILMDEQRDAEARDLMARFPDDFTALWGYLRALLKFRAVGDTLFSLRALNAAKRDNPRVPAYLLGTARLPKHPPTRRGIGDETEAQWYTVEAMSHWANTPGALAWLKQSLKTAKAAANVVRDGPMILLNPWEVESAAHCPNRGDEPLDHQASVGVVVVVEPSFMVVASVPGRYCESCDFLIVQRADIEAEITSQDPGLVGNDYIALGTIPAADLPNLPEDGTAEWIIKHLKTFREEFDPTALANDWGWLDDIDLDLEGDATETETETAADHSTAVDAAFAVGPTVETTTR